MRQFLILTLFTFFSATTFSQEALIDLQSMPVKKSTITKSKALEKSAPLSLPFYDDFSNGKSSPNLTNWQPNAVLVNQTYAINPLTIGVATLDAIGSDGKIYNHLTALPQKADSLTSRPLNLSANTVDDSLYLSFQYQPKGLGEQPETNDSLIVYFYSKIEKQWVKAWAASANFITNKVTEVNHFEKKTKIQSSSSIDSSFFCAILPIKETRFLSDSFQFKIINYASLAPNTQYLSIRSNCDHWNLDLVYLKQGRTFDETAIEDIAFVNPIKSLLKNYESIPWRHMNSVARQNELKSPFQFKTTIRNFFPSNTEFNRKYYLTNLSDQIPYKIIDGDSTINAYQTIDFKWNFEYNFESPWIDSAKFMLDAKLEIFKTMDNYLLNNDQLNYIQKFYNYYAYDDGSAENGYGLFGEGSNGGMIAVKFHSYEIDSLKGILFYFNEIPDFTRTNFNLVIWSDNNGKPGVQLYKELVKKPLSTYNQDSLYKINSKLKLGGDFWVGTINETEDFLNIGFDRNNNHSNKIYFNLTGAWQQTSFTGSLMIKPVFGKFTSWQTGVDKPVAETKFSLYPNPAKSFIRLNLPEGLKPEWVRIVNLSGQIMMSKPYDGNNIDVSILQTGIYLFQLIQNNKSTSTQKLVIIR